jgi:hypothetical protein
MCKVLEEGIEMNVISCSGFECEKKLPTTLEDLFNQSDVVYLHEGVERKLNVTYVRYFDQYMQEQGIYSAEETGVPFYHIAALLILMKHNGYVADQRLYFNETEPFLRAFRREDIGQAVKIYQEKK